MLAVKPHEVESLLFEKAMNALSGAYINTVKQQVFAE